jgi:hypothetical protein
MTPQTGTQNSRSRWTVDQAQRWHGGRPWIVGCNFIPSTAVNQLEMWQRDSFDPETIDRELGWASECGFNAARVFLHDLLWQDSPDGLVGRMERFLDIAFSHGVSAMFVIFDGVWDPLPGSGPQRPPRPGVHNSRWVQSPGAELLADVSRHSRLESYVKGVIGHFRDEPRVLAWDLFNEADNPNTGTYGETELPNKAGAAESLLRKAFGWAREANPSQPLTAGVWRGRVTGEEVPSISRLMLDESDVISFHSYLDAERVRRRIDELGSYERPLMLTEFLARGSGSTFEDILPVAKERNVAAFCWGLVRGKTQTVYPWDSWARSYAAEPEPWFHDVLREDGSAYRDEEVALIRRLSR